MVDCASANFVKSASRPRRSVCVAVGRVLLPVFAALLMSSCGVVNGIPRPELHEVEARFSGLPEDMDGFRIALVTDVHLNDRDLSDYLSRIVDQVNRLAPDLVAITGDLVDGHAEGFAERLGELRALHARYGVFAVPGNHEYCAGYREIATSLSALGVTVLENSHRMVRPDFAVAGVTDPAALIYHLPGPDIAAALKDIPKGTFILLLAHRPALCVSAAEFGVNLQLSGHTHGGMIVGLDRLVADRNRGFAAGLYQVGGTTLYVSRGTAAKGPGWLGLPGRVGVPSEITLLILRRG